MNIATQVYQGLSSSEKLLSQLHRGKNGIYHGRSPDAGSYPILVYSIISDVPALSADGIEQEHRVTVRIHILTKDGAYEQIESTVIAIMNDLGFRRLQSVEMAERNAFVKIIDFCIGTGVNESWQTQK